MKQIKQHNNHKGQPTKVPQRAHGARARGRRKGAGTEGVRREGARTEGAQREGARTEGARTEGAWMEGARMEGALRLGALRLGTRRAEGGRHSLVKVLCGHARLFMRTITCLHDNITQYVISVWQNKAKYLSCSATTNTYYDSTRRLVLNLLNKHVRAFKSPFMKNEKLKFKRRHRSFLQRCGDFACTENASITILSYAALHWRSKRSLG
jgi:hypothetical protein